MSIMLLLSHPLPESVCYLTDPGDGSGVPTTVCGIDTSEPPDGIIDTYVDPDPETGLRPEGSIPTTVYCRIYEDKWVFNIGDFVTYLWSVDNNGTKLLQVRFYPNNPELMAPPSKQDNLTTRWGTIKAE